LHDPSLGQFQVTLLGADEKSRTVQIVNTEGRLLQTITTANQTIGFDLTGHPAGTYHVKVSIVDGGEWTTTVIVQR
jgi:hypothetical protein